MTPDIVDGCMMPSAEVYAAHMDILVTVRDAETRGRPISNLELATMTERGSYFENSNYCRAWIAICRAGLVYERHGLSAFWLETLLTPYGRTYLRQRTGTP